LPVVGDPPGLHRAWPVSLTVPYPEAAELVFGRCAARSAQFGGTAAAGGAAVVIGAAAGRCADDVTVRARGELLERAGTIVSGRLAESGPGLEGSFAELSRRGLPVLDPAGLPRGRRSVRDARLRWVDGRSEVTGEPVLVPAGAVYLRHRPPQGCEAGVRSGSTGLSAHRDHGSAAGHAAREILERDGLVRAWYGDPDTRLRTVEPTGPAGALCRSLGLLARLWSVEHAGEPRCVIACVAGPDGAGEAFGARYGGPDDPATVAAAVDEALMVRWSMTTPAAGDARRRLRERGGAPLTGIEHAVHAFDTGHGAAHLTARATGGAAPALAAPPDPLVQLRRATAGDVVAVDTTPAELAGVTVLRLVAPGARQLPGRELSGPPHPFG
jgi:ribosomal protein S12 methylthiotransferase accessory factor